MHQHLYWFLRKSSKKASCIRKICKQYGRTAVAVVCIMVIMVNAIEKSTARYKKRAGWMPAQTLNCIWSWQMLSIVWRNMICCPLQTNWIVIVRSISLNGDVLANNNNNNHSHKYITWPGLVLIVRRIYELYTDIEEAQSSGFNIVVFHVYEHWDLYMKPTHCQLYI